jgi:hypothetical protein
MDDSLIGKGWGRLRQNYRSNNKDIFTNNYERFTSKRFIFELNT